MNLYYLPFAKYTNNSIKDMNININDNDIQKYRYEILRKSYLFILKHFWLSNYKIIVQFEYNLLTHTY